MTTSETIIHALRRNVEQAKSKAGRKLAEDELASYLARNERKPFTPSPFSRFVQSLETETP
jgi:hypothetical protein